MAQSQAAEENKALTDILRVISSPPGDLQLVFDTILSHARRLCGGSAAVLWQYDGTQLRFAARNGGSKEAEAYFRNHPLALGKYNPTPQAALEKRAVHVLDVFADRKYRPLVPKDSLRTLPNATTVLAVPLLRQNELFGVISIWRFEKRLFTRQQVAMVEAFASQAAMAIHNVRLHNEIRAALEQQTATAEILKVISASPTDVQPVFDTIVRNATRLGNAAVGFLISYDGTTMQLAAQYNLDPEEDSIYRPAFPRPAARDTLTGRSILDRAVINLADIQSSDFGQGTKERARRAGYRSSLVVPMLRGGVPIGTLNIQRREAGAFADGYVALLKTFADQAVIAIENARLFNETQEALARQAAAAQVLRSISESASDTAPVFSAILDCCNRLIPSIDYVQVQLIEGSDRVRLVDHRFGQVRGAAPGKQDERRAELMAREAAHFPRPLAGSTLERALNQGRLVILADTLNGPDTPPGTLVEARRWGHSYSQITVPLMREGRCIGAIEAFRRQLGGFEAKESSLLESFADQAVIAIENVRLFNETKEALERQTATAEILKVISSSPTDVQPVFDAIVKSGLRLFNGHGVGILLVDGERIQIGSVGGIISLDAARKRYPIPLNSETVSGRAIVDRSFVNIADCQAPEAPELVRSLAQDLGYRAAASAPMMREGVATGAITVVRSAPGALAEKEVALLKTFADQAVIAIENVRLFKELQTRTEALTKSVGQLTALGEVGQAISSTLELETVLKTIVQHAVRLTELDGGSIYEYDESSEEFQLQAAENQEPELVEAVRRTPIRKGDGTVGGTAVTLEATQVPDILDSSYQSTRKELLIRAGYRAVLTVPLLREDHLLGALSVTRKTPGAFAPEVVELMKTFATQSAMAIQNARLFREIAEKGRQLEVASRHKSQFLASMSHELRTPLNALLGFNEMILGDVYGEVPGDMKPPLAQMQSSGKHLLRLINNVLDLAKIEAGRMELALADYSVQDIVEGVRSTLLPLAAEKGLELIAAVAAGIPPAHGDPGRITQCLMNLAGNSLKFTKAGKVEISVAADNGLLRYRVADTGIGIPADKIAGLFTEFKQTDATVASEYGGTGLGLSISKKFVEMHGGLIWVESEPGRGSVFTFEVPLRAGAQ